MIAWLKGLFDRMFGSKPVIGSVVEVEVVSVNEVPVEPPVEIEQPAQAESKRKRDLTLGYSLIKEFEGFEAKAYPDPASGGKPYTIGYGTTVYPDGKAVKLGDVCTRAQAQLWLERDCEKFCTGIDKLIKVPINDNQYGALLSFTYNVGLGKVGIQGKGLAGSTLLVRVNQKASNDVIKLEFAKWNKAAGKVMAGLTRRRTMEAALYATPVVTMTKPA